VADPFTIKEVNPHGAIEVEDAKDQMSLTVNGQRLNIYIGGDVERLITIIHLRDP